MKIALIALVATLYVVPYVAALKSTDPGHHFEARPRAGHFYHGVFEDLYATYAKVIVRPHFERDHDDKENYTPSAPDCIIYLKQFTTRDYQVNDLEEIVIMDACLGYLYDQKFAVYHTQDKEESSLVNEELDSFIADSRLKQLYEATNIDNESPEAQNCVATLLLRTLQLRGFKDTTHSAYIAVMNDFGNCHNHLSAQFLSEDDTYGKILYATIKKRGNELFHAELNAINSAARSLDNKEYFNKFARKLVSLAKFKSIGAQSHTRGWFRDLFEVLGVFTSGEARRGDDQTNTRQAIKLIRHFLLDQSNAKRRIIDNISKYVNSKFSLKERQKLRNNGAGITEFNELMDNMCLVFRITDTTSSFNFALSFGRLIGMLEHQDLFGIDNDQFYAVVLNNAYETAPVYLGLVACNIFSQTEGILMSQPSNAPPAFTITWKRIKPAEKYNWPVPPFA